MRFNPEAAHRHFSHPNFFRRHSLSIIAASVTVVWLILYCFSSPDTHIGSFFGNAIADWSGVLLTVIGTKFLFEKGSRQSRKPHDKGMTPTRRFVIDHSLSIFLVLSGVAWTVIFLVQNPTGKWGQVVGNVVSEWTQQLGLVLLTKRFVEPGSKV
jgi:hypothetical protein